MRESISPELLRLLSSYIRWADVVHLEAVYSFPTIPTLMICRLLKKPLVWSPRGALEFWSGTRRKNGKNIYETVCRMVLPSKVVLHATSDKESERKSRAIARDCDGGHSKRGGAGVGSDECVKNPDCFDSCILDVWIPRRESIIFSRACAQLNGKMAKPWHLTIAGFGEPSYERHIRQTVEAHRLQNRVSLAGPVHGRERKIFQEADVVVVPSHMENFCIVVAEALAHGIPVIASRGTPWQGLEAHHCGLWVDNQPPSLAQAITRMSHLPLAEMGARGRQWITEEFTWPHVAEQMEQCYQSLVEKRA